MIRCRYSQHAKETFRLRHPDRLGMIVRIVGSSFRIVWDGTKTRTAIHKSYVEVLEEVRVPEPKEPYQFYVHPEDK